MQMNSFVALTVVCVIFAIGDFFSMKTKAMCSMMFISAVLFLIGFQTGILPRDLFIISMLVPAGGVLIAFVITHMGALLNTRELIEQWKTLVICVSVMVGIGLVFFFIGSIFMGREYAIAIAPVVAGGVVAALVMGGAGVELGLPQLAVFTALFVAFQNFAGFPVASFFLNKEAAGLKTKFAAGGASLDNMPKVTTEEKKPLIPPLPEGIRNSANVLLAKLGISACIAIWLADMTGGIIHRFVMCLIIGVLMKKIGFLEEAVMVKANSFGFAMVTIMAIIFGNLADASMEMLLALALPLLTALLLGFGAIVPISLIAGSLLKLSSHMSIAIGVTCMVGFPGTFIISNEIANSAGKSPEEKKYILDQILPKMLIAGFATVTVGSVIMAGIMANFL